MFESLFLKGLKQAFQTPYHQISFLVGNLMHPKWSVVSVSRPAKKDAVNSLLFALTDVANLVTIAILTKLMLHSPYITLSV